MKSLAARLFCTTAFSLLALPQIASAQDGGDPAATDEAPMADAAPVAAVEDIVVTAQKRAENIQDVPIAVTAFTAEMIARNEQRDLQDLTGMVPNLEVNQSSAGPNAANVSLRGVMFQEIEKSFEPPVGVVLDGVYLSTSTGQLAQTFDFERVEVIAGPQGTLFGKNTTGGVINIVRSRANLNEVAGRGRVTVGRHGRHDFEAVASIPIVRGIAALKVAGFSQNDHGAFYNSVLDDNVGRRAFDAGSVALRIRPSARTEINLTYDHVSDHSDLPPKVSALTSQLIPLPVGGYVSGNDTPCRNPNLVGICTNDPFNLPKNVTTATFRERARYKLDAGTIEARQDFGSFALVGITGLRRSREWSTTDLDVTAYNLYENVRPQKYRQFSQEVRVESELNGPFNFVGGYYYFDSAYTLDWIRAIDLAAIVPTLAPGVSFTRPQTVFHQDSSSHAVFLQATFDVTAELRLIAGARQTWDAKSMTYQGYTGTAAAPLELGPPNPGDFVAQSAKWSKFTPKLGIQYSPSDDLMLYGTYSRGFNAGGYNGRASIRQAVGPYQPETVDNYEVGFKSDWMDRKLRVNGALFWMEFRDKQLDIIIGLTESPFTTAGVTNAASQRIRGAELSVTAVPVPRLFLNANVGLLDSKYTDFTAILLAGGPLSDNTVLTPRRSPDYTVGLNADYSVPIGSGEIGGNVAVKVVDDLELDLLNDPRGHVPTTAKIDVSVRYGFRAGGTDLELSLFGKNITNQTPANAFVTGYRGNFIEYISQDIGATYGASLRAEF